MNNIDKMNDQIHSIREIKKMSALAKSFRPSCHGAISQSRIPLTDAGGGAQSVKVRRNEHSPRQNVIQLHYSAVS